MDNLPDAELVISSYNNFPKSEEDNKILEIINKTPSIKHMGKLNRYELYNLMSSAEYWLYPSYFQETSCITSLELLASEVICLYYPVAGLVNTVGNYGVQISEGNEIDALLSLSVKKKTELKKKGKDYALSCSWKNRANVWLELLRLNSSFEYKIKIINLKERTDRKKYMTDQFSKNDITNYEFFEAINGKNIKESEEIRMLFNGNDFNYKKGVIGCTLSHIHLWNELIHDNTNNFYVILEDDIELCNNFKQHLDNVCKLFDEQNLHHLALGEYDSNKQFPDITSNIIIHTKDLYKDGHITFAYIISKPAIIKAFEYINSCSIKCALDNPQTFGYILNYGAINYKLVDCKQVNEFGTDIQNNNIENYFEFTKNNINNTNKIVTVSFSDWWRSEYCGGEFDTNNNYFTNLLRKYGNYHVKIIEPTQNPDILFYSIFGNSHKNLKAKRKVFFSGEPYGQRNDADFNISFDPNSHKNTRLPLWLCYFSNSILDESIKRKNKKGNNNIYEKRAKFCSFIASGPGLKNNRKEFVDKLSQYKMVDCGGRYLNNIGGEVPIGLNCSGKIEHNNNYKFAIAFESASYPGYVTEKICDVYKSNCIPIYWGHPDIIKDFNPKTFINANDFTNFDELVEYIIKVDNDYELYASFFKEPMLSPIWIDIFTDPNDVFFKNLVDKIVGEQTSLLDDYFRSLDKLTKNVICMPKTTQIDIRDHDGNKINIEHMEKDEQDLANKYILEDDIVLELGARYGSVSCIINNKLNNKNNQVVVEPDDRVWYALEENKKRNNCEFNIIKGFISNKKLDLTNLDNYYGYGSTFIENSNTKIPSYTLNEIKKTYNLKFNVLVADCEGFLEVFFDENPELYDEIRLIIFEEDYREKCNYNKIKYELRKRNFTQLLEGNQNVWVKYI